MDYRQLDKDTIPAYLENIPAVVDVLGKNRVLEIEEVGDGNLNYVFKVSNVNNPKGHIILKQAVPYLRIAGEAWPLSKDRMAFEVSALKIYNELVPEYSPKVYHEDESMSLVILQCLSDCITLRYGMIQGTTYPKLAEHISLFLAQTLFKTSSLYLNSENKRQLMRKFVHNMDLCKLTEDLVFTFPGMEHDSNYQNPGLDEVVRELRNDRDYKTGVLRLKYLFMNKTDALLHGDMHTGSLMVNASETYAIDPEFAFFGPFGFDIGKIMGNFLLSYISHYHCSPDTGYREWVLNTCYEIWNKFSEEFLALWSEQECSALLMPDYVSAAVLQAYKDEFMLSLFREAVGFAGCSMARRVIGIAGVADIRGIEDIKVRTELEKASLQLSRQLIVHHQSMNTIEDLQALIDGFFRNSRLALETVTS